MPLRLPASKTLWIDLGLAGFVLAIILVYTYVYFIDIPYIGLDIALDDQTVKWIYPNRYNSEVFRLADKILLFGDIDLEQAYNQRTQPTYGNLKMGDVLDVFIRRGNEEKQVQWVIPGRTVVEFIQRLLSYWYLAFIFWAFGLATALLVRPRDDRWRLLVAFNYLIALWIMIGASSDSRIWFSAVFMRAISWLILVVSLALHWMFPQRITQPRAITRNIFFLAGIALAFGEVFLFLPGNAYSIAIALCFLGSIGLLVYQWLSNPSIRTVLALPLLVLGILILLAAESNLNQALGVSSAPAEIILLFIPLLPMSYFYIIYTRQTGGMEIRLNRWIAMFVFFSIIILPIFPVLAALNLWFSNTGLIEYMAVFYCVFTGMIGITFFPKFQRWFNYKFLGIPRISDHLVSSITTHLSGSLEEQNLVYVLNSIVFPSFLIRQALLLRLLTLEPGSNRWEYRILSMSGLPQPQYFCQEDLQVLIKDSGPAKIRPNAGYLVNSHLDWVRLVLPLSLENRLVGLCLLGRRDPDDRYAPSEIPLSQAVMDQVTLAQVPSNKHSTCVCF